MSVAESFFEQVDLGSDDMKVRSLLQLTQW